MKNKKNIDSPPQFRTRGVIEKRPIIKSPDVSVAPVKVYREKSSCRVTGISFCITGAATSWILGFFSRDDEIYHLGGQMVTRNNKIEPYLEASGLLHSHVEKLNGWKKK